ncbi:MAG TPA: hypothetical protein VJO52_07600 [Gemmatimonadaceae bacterium]|nr:hypothetical protein [Gemmatimonadaceae bacterium]
MGILFLIFGEFKVGGAQVIVRSIEVMDEVNDRCAVPVPFAVSLGARSPPALGGDV